MKKTVNRKPSLKSNQERRQLIEPPPSQVQEQVNPDVSDTTEDENKENDEISTIEGTETSSATTELQQIYRRDSYSFRHDRLSR